MTRAQLKDDLRKQGERLKKDIKVLADSLDRKGRLKLKLELMKADVSETVARQLMNGTYPSNPRQDLIEVMEDTIASNGKAKAS